MQPVTTSVKGPLALERRVVGYAAPGPVLGGDADRAGIDEYEVGLCRIGWRAATPGRRIAIPVADDSALFIWQP